MFRSFDVSRWAATRPAPLTSDGWSRGQPRSCRAHQGLGRHDGSGFAAGLVGIGDLLGVGRRQVEVVVTAAKGRSLEKGRPARWPLRRAKMFQPKTDVSPRLAGEVPPAAGLGFLRLAR